VARHDRATIPVRTPGAYPSLLEDGDLPAGLGQVVGGADSDHPSTDDNCTLTHVTLWPVASWARYARK